MWNELILTLMRYVMGEAAYEMFMEQFAEMPQSKRKITLPSKATLVAHEKKRLVWEWGEKRKLDSKITWNIVAEESGCSNAEEAKKIYKKIAQRNRAWFEMGFAGSFDKVQEMRGYQIADLMIERNFDKFFPPTT